MPEFRKKDLATELVLLAEKWVKEQGLSTLAFHVLNFHSKARALYQKLGYNLVATHNESCF
ncbi:MAG: GNAT family N-acetyltransferase [Candidatus Heimdallarchaeaceae archaeon]